MTAKRFPAILLLLAMGVGVFAGCGGKPAETSGSSKPAAVSSAPDFSPAGSEAASADGTPSSKTGAPSVGAASSAAPSAPANGLSLSVSKKLAPMTAEDDAHLLENPDRGFRTELVWNVREAVASGDPSSYLYSKLDIYLNTLGEPSKLMLAYVYLTDYRNTEIDDAGMNAMKTFFELCHSKRVKLMLRYAYCDSFTNLSTGADQTTMIRHMKQLAPQVKAYADVIHVISCGFIGSYGEWAEVYQSPPVDYKTVLESIMKYLCEPSGLHFLARLPEHKNLLPKSSPYYKMIGFTNDALFGAQDKPDWESGGYRQGTAAWNQVVKEGALTPQDGEMFTNPNLLETNRKPSGMEVILETAHHRHTSMSFWHGYHEVGKNKSGAVIERWKSEAVTEALLKQNHIVYAPSWFKNKNGAAVPRNAFEFIRDHLGYKLEAQELKITGSGKAGGSAEVTMTLKNYGMSAAFCLESGFAVLDGNYDPVRFVKAGTPADWHSHSPADHKDTNVPVHTVKGGVKLPAKPGRYYIAFYLKNTMGDFARLSNRLGNAGGYNVLHEFDIAG